MNDISENLLSLTRLFADNTPLFFSAANIQDIESILNHDFARISEWARKWLVNFNPNKTLAMLFSYLSSGDYPHLIFDGVILNFHFLWDHWAHSGYFVNRLSPKPVLGGACSLANYIAPYENA